MPAKSVKISEIVEEKHFDKNEKILGEIKRWEASEELESIDPSEITSEMSDQQEQYEVEYFYQKNNVHDRIFYLERINHRMREILKSQSFCIRKKANYPEKITCGLFAQDNVYKLYEWDEDMTEKGLRLARYEQKSSSCLRWMCCSYQRGYRTVGTTGNRAHAVTKSLRPFKVQLPCAKEPPVTAVFDY